MKRSLSSAPRPAGYSDVQSDFTRLAELPAGYSEFHRLAFYNIDWNGDDIEAWHTMHGLATEICDMVHDKCVDAVGICGVFNLRDEPANYMAERRPDIMEHIVAKLNSRAGQPATSANSSAERPAWKGQLDGHYIFVWNSNRLVLTTYTYINCGIMEHPWRMAQYLQFQPAESHYHSPVSLHVCHNHSPDSPKGGLLTDSIAERIFENLWAHVMDNEPCGRNASQPVAIFGGDFNCNSLRWAQCLKHAMGTQASRRSVQICFSQTPPSHVGDVGLVFNACAVQEDSGWGKSHIRADRPRPFSDYHDVVLVPFRWTRRLLNSAPCSSQAVVLGETNKRSDVAVTNS